jgi:hypothetical protein
LQLIVQQGSIASTTAAQNILVSSGMFFSTKLGIASRYGSLMDAVGVWGGKCRAVCGKCAWR